MSNTNNQPKNRKDSIVGFIKMYIISFVIGFVFVAIVSELPIVTVFFCCVIGLTVGTSIGLLIVYLYSLIKKHFGLPKKV